MEGQTHSGMSRGAKMSLTLHEPIYSVLYSNHHTTSTHAPICKRNNRLPTKSHDELKDTSIVILAKKEEGKRNDETVGTGH
jgi:hypothetical protein